MCLQSRWLKGVFVLGSTCAMNTAACFSQSISKATEFRAKGFQSPQGPLSMAKLLWWCLQGSHVFFQEIFRTFSKVLYSIAYYFKLKLQKQGQELSLHSGFLPPRITRSHPRTDTIFIHLSYFYGTFVLFCFRVFYSFFNPNFQSGLST